jgi:hypothetical protein
MDQGAQSVLREEERPKENKDKHLVDELRSLGIDPKKKIDPEDKEEFEELVDAIKQSMFQDYVIAYSREGDKYEQEAKSTVNP